MDSCLLISKEITNEERVSSGKFSKVNEGHLINTKIVIKKVLKNSSAEQEIKILQLIRSNYIPIFLGIHNNNMDSASNGNRASFSTAYSKNQDYCHNRNIHQHSLINYNSKCNGINDTIINNNFSDTFINKNNYESFNFNNSLTNNNSNANYNTTFQSCSNKQTISIILQKIEGKTLDQYFKTSPLKLLKYIHLQELATVLKHLHKTGLIHKDIKPNNIMIDNKLNLKLLDFGISSKAETLVSKSNSDTSEAGTFLYMSPEYAPEFDKHGNVITKVTEKRDVWAFGLIINEMFSGETPWCGMIKYASVEVISLLYSKVKFPISEKISFIEREFVNGCTKYELAKRFSSDDCFLFSNMMVYLEVKKIIKKFNETYCDKLIKDSNEYINNDNDSNTKIIDNSLSRSNNNSNKINKLPNEIFISNNIFEVIDYATKNKKNNKSKNKITDKKSNIKEYSNIPIITNNTENANNANNANNKNNTVSSRLSLLVSRFKEEILSESFVDYFYLTSHNNSKINSNKDINNMDSSFLEKSYSTYNTNNSFYSNTEKNNNYNKAYTNIKSNTNGYKKNKNKDNKVQFNNNITHNNTNTYRMSNKNKNKNKTSKYNNIDSKDNITDYSVPLFSKTNSNQIDKYTEISGCANNDNNDIDISRLNSNTNTNVNNNKDNYTNKLLFLSLLKIQSSLQQLYYHNKKNKTTNASKSKNTNNINNSQSNEVTNNNINETPDINDLETQTKPISFILNNKDSVSINPLSKIETEIATSINNYNNDSKSEINNITNLTNTNNHITNNNDNIESNSLTDISFNISTQNKIISSKKYSNNTINTTNSINSNNNEKSLFDLSFNDKKMKEDIKKIFFSCLENNASNSNNNSFNYNCEYNTSVINNYSIDWNSIELVKTITINLSSIKTNMYNLLTDMVIQNEFSCENYRNTNSNSNNYSNTDSITNSNEFKYYNNQLLFIALMKDSSFLILNSDYQIIKSYNNINSNIANSNNSKNNSNSSMISDFSVLNNNKILYNSNNNNLVVYDILTSKETIINLKNTKKILKVIVMNDTSNTSNYNNNNINNNSVIIASLNHKNKTDFCLFNLNSKSKTFICPEFSEYWDGKVLKLKEKFLFFSERDVIVNIANISNLIDIHNHNHSSNSNTSKNEVIEIKCFSRVEDVCFIRFNKDSKYYNNSNNNRSNSSSSCFIDFVFVLCIGNVIKVYEIINSDEKYILNISVNYVGLKFNNYDTKETKDTYDNKDSCKLFKANFKVPYPYTKIISTANNEENNTKYNNNNNLVTFYVFKNKLLLFNSNIPEAQLKKEIVNHISNDNDSSSLNRNRNLFFIPNNSSANSLTNTGKIISYNKEYNQVSYFY